MRISIVFRVGLILLLAGCATTYKDGKDFRRISKDMFEVSFYGNGFTDSQRAKDFAKLNAADVTLLHGFKFFEVWGSENLTSLEIAPGSSGSYTTGVIGGGGVYSGTTFSSSSDIPILRPAHGFTIKCYDVPPGRHAGEIFDARKVRDEIRAKYRINQ